MAKLWAGRAEKETAQIADDFNSSLHFDCRMYRQDITGSMAHAAMLAHSGILTEQESLWSGRDHGGSGRGKAAI